MKYELELLQVSRLSNLEAGQLIQRHVDDFSALLPAPTDAPLVAYVGTLETKNKAYGESLSLVRKDEYTTKVTGADAARDLAISNLGKALDLHETSDLPAEAEAAAGLQLVFRSYKNLAAWNYEAETRGIDAMLDDLASTANASRVTSLGIQRYVDKLSSTNVAFKTIFATRSSTQATTPGHDAKQLRADLFATYKELANYLVAMANALGTGEFTTPLALVNTQRKYYADVLARRWGKTASGTASPAGTTATS